MKAIDLILSRRTAHSYSEEMISTEVIENSILVAIHALNHKLTYPWRFFVIGPKTRKLLGELSLRLKSKKSALSETVKLAMINKYNHEGTLIVAAINKSSDEITRKEDYAAMACAIQNMSLYLHDQGLGSKWSTGKIIYDEETYKILKLDATQSEICGFIWLGRPKPAPSENKRPPFKQFLFYRD